MNKRPVFVDSFTTGLDELSKQAAASKRIVLRKMHKAGCFSVFEVTDNDTLANMMTDLLEGGYFEDLGGQFPWTKIKLTQKGLRLIGVKK